MTLHETSYYCRACRRLWITFGARADTACAFCGSREVEAVAS